MTSGLRWVVLVLILESTTKSSVAQERVPLRGHTDRVYGVAFTPDGKYLASAGMDGTVRIWEVATGKESVCLKAHPGGANAVAFAPDGRMLASAGEDGTVRLWDASTGRELRAFKGHNNIVYAVAFSPDGRLVASGGEDEKVRVWEADTGRERFVFTSHIDGVDAVAFSPDGRMLASGGDVTIRIWDVATGVSLATLSGHHGDIYSLKFNRENTTLVSGSEDETVKVWDVAAGKERLTIRPGHGWVFAVEFSRDGQTLAVANGDGTVQLWDPATGRELETLRGHAGEVYCLAADGKGTLASGSRDRTIRLWNWPDEGGGLNSAIRPVPRRDFTWVARHEALRAHKGDVDVLFLGDSITRGWEDHKAIWETRFVPLKAANYGINGDRTQHVLWRIHTGKELDGVKPRLVVLLIGTNNLGENRPDEIASGVTAIVQELRRQRPQARILLLGLFPRRPQVDNPARAKIAEVNRQLAKLGDGKTVHFLDLGPKFLEPTGELSRDVMYDYLHLSARGYQIWADALGPTLERLLKE